MTDLAKRVRINQKKLASELKPRYDFIVCGSGSSGSVVSRRLAENPDLSVLLLEAGGHDDLPSISDGRQWASNIKTERDWNFQTRSNPHLNGRSDSLAAGKVLGGGSSINAMAWARGHKSDWDYFAHEAGDPVESLRIADGSIMPRVTTGNTMAPCVIIGERAAEAIRTAYKL